MVVVVVVMVNVVVVVVVAVVVIIIKKTHIILRQDLYQPILYLGRKVLSGGQCIVVDIL